ncbi:MAG TPA: DUF1501 domain-containing protein [Planctomicrobium sp.]|nr:DUF1501 domain-containing protein [Planctomicrobium sp.]
MTNYSSTRREFLSQSIALTAAATATGLTTVHASSKEALKKKIAGTAEHCIFLWLGGGASQIDTFDPKRVSSDGRKDPGSAYPAIDTAIPDVQVCEHLARTASRLDRCVPIRSVHHDVIDEHAAAAYRMHVGRPTNDTVVNPSLGSMITYMKQPANDHVPAYVLMGNPSPARDPGFLGAKYGYLTLLETNRGPEGVVRPQRVTEERHSRRMKLLEQMRSHFTAETGDERLVKNYLEAADAGFRLSGPEFLNVFDLNQEPTSLREAYGDDFGQRCLLARRLVERGSRFVEVSYNLNFVNGTGWDTHQEGQENQHLLIQSLDQSFAALLDDLEEKKLLDKTLIVISTEFGRPAKFDGGGGRGHHSDSFSVLLAGGGLKTGQAIGITDELGVNIVDRPVSVPDLFATILAGMGIDWTEELYAGDRPVPPTEGGIPIAELFT